MKSIEEIVEFIKNKESYLIDNDKLSKGIPKYLDIIENLQTVDVSKDEQYRRNYSAFFRLRWINIDARNAYFNLLEEFKTKEIPDYTEIWKEEANVGIYRVIHKLYKVLGKIHFSFASKLIHVLSPDKFAIYDGNVCEALGISKSLSQGKGLEKIKFCRAKHEQITKILEELLSNKDIQKIIKSLKQVYNCPTITDLKMLDFILWCLGAKK